MTRRELLATFGPYSDDPKTQIAQGKPVCVVSCQRSPEPVFLDWKATAAGARGDFFVRSGGPGTVKLSVESANEYIRTRFPSAAKPADSPSERAATPWR